jgi:enamine deaminase RidA (YjgF/YER057c/UK114 family)
MVFVAGMIGWDTEGRFASDTIGAQVRHALQNIVDVLKVAGARLEHIVRMTWYVTDKHEYVAAYPEIGIAFRELIGRSPSAPPRASARAPRSAPSAARRTPGAPALPSCCAGRSWPGADAS